MNNTMGDKIRKARLKRKLMQNELSIMLGVSLKTVGRWERNEYKPSLINQRRIEKILEINL